MSTKGSLILNMPDFPLDSPNISQVPPEMRDSSVPAFHLFEESFEKDGSVYLELPGGYFEATPDCIVVKIPKEVWNRIVKIGPRP